MQLLQPQLLWLLLIAIVPIALYLFRRKSKTVPVATLVFFRTLAREHRESAWLRRLKKLLSLLLTLLVLLLVVLVLARPVAEHDEAGGYRTVVVLLDRSASMALEDESGRSRLEAAKDLLRQRLEHLPGEIGVALVTYDARPEVVQPRTRNRRELVSRLDAVEVRPMEGNLDAAMESARLLGGLEQPALIWHFSDRFSESPPGDEEAVVGDDDAIDTREVGLALEEASNVGITAFRVRPVPLEYSRFEVFTQVALNAAALEPVEVRLEVRLGGIPDQLREIELSPGERLGLTFRVEAVGDSLLELRLDAEDDRFPLDDVVAVPLPEQNPIVAAWIRPEERADPFTRLALSAIQESGRLELLAGSPEAWPLSDPVDAVIFDGWLPDEWPEETPAVVINPPDSSGPIRVRRLEAAVPHDGVRVGNSAHPVLFRVSSGRVAVRQTAVIEAAGSLEPLWLAGREPVLSAGEVAGERVVVMGFSPGLSERLPLTASFPLLMGNALLWAVDRESRSERGALYRTGELVSIDSETIEWREWTGDRWRSRRVDTPGPVAEMDRIGIWRTGDGREGAAQLLSVRESDLPVQAETDGDTPAMEAGGPGRLPLWLLGGVIAVLLLESFLFHRLAVY